ncbi:hypothetical protein, partial [Anaerotruncus colihominis]|uniref:hypothetical protein n=1 Tax=Anaerotruncus colihominis TaxID=169435 RepID=UPI0034A47057
CQRRQSLSQQAEGLAPFFIFRKRALKLQRRENHYYAGDKRQWLLEEIRRQINKRGDPNPRELMSQSNQNEVNMSM